jgi:cytochrome c556
MDGIIDPAADDLWGSVETTVSSQGVQEKQPHSPDEWAEVRRKAITLIEASNLLAIEGRQVGAKPFPAEAEGALDSAQIQQRIAAERAVFVDFAGSLRASAQQALAAIDAQDPAALVNAGGVIDGVCEGCHMRFWYPNQVIPPLP